MTRIYDFQHGSDKIEKYVNKSINIAQEINNKELEANLQVVLEVLHNMGHSVITSRLERSHDNFTVLYNKLFDFVVYLEERLKKYE